ncbi:prolyl endopeptidase [Plasmopara halstedii]|uniref:Prolyl endopeptidase n=1 Tax=Plasmopara halstedii TaxID=4781 RepID=A0A0P1B7E6_PLAHL|nr:prolyl endopeptidase [Plasmopara halstedii]CEG50038.1 prolyl endopeptidase [Plasmopara halstedii]|eukprot:XP_024586407.1 prolyl endopeptidase [Plasmopara halstedii]
MKSASLLTEKVIYPAVRRGDVVENLHGVQVADPYRWLEDPDSPETREFVTKQNEVTQRVLTKMPFVAETKERMTELFNYEKYSAPRKHGGKYVFSKNDGLQNQSVLYIQDELHSSPRVLLDPNLFAEDGTAALSSSAFSEAKQQDGKLYFAHGISRGGSDWQTIKVMAVHDNHKIVEDTVEWVKFSRIAWTHDDNGFFYSRYPPPEKMKNHEHDGIEGYKRGTETDANMNHQVWYHKLHTPQSEDKLVYAYPTEPTFTVSAEVSDDGKKLLLSVHDGCKNANMIHVADLSAFEQFLNGPNDTLIVVTKLVDNMDAAYSYILNDGEFYYFKTNAQAPRERVVRVKLSDDNAEIEWEVIIPEQPEAIVIEEVHPVAPNLLVVQLVKDVHNELHVYNLDGEYQYEIPLPSVGTVGLSSKRTESEVFYHFISFLYPGSIFRIDLSKGKAAPNAELFRETKVKGFDPSLFEAKQVFYPSKDGTKIPMFLVKQKNAIKDGNLPVYLYGYGGFNISLTPAFSVSRLVFLQHFNGMLALPNLRGGGEYGEQWHQDGMLHKKQNVFDDFHSAAEYLIKENYTNSEKIAIHGGSNGGLLVAAASNQRPDLYRCVVGAVGVMDMLRFHKFTIGHAWRTDYGDPEVANDFHYILRYSPVHNVPHADSPAMQKLAERGGFPSVLLTTGDHDDRVVPLHSYKLIAELQYQLGNSESQTNPLLIRIDTKSGHGAGKPTTKIIEETSEVFAFIAWNLGAPFVA